MPEVEELIAIGEVEKPRADSIQADFRASRKEISTDAGRCRVGCFLGPILPSVAYVPIGTSALALPM